MNSRRTTRMAPGLMGLVLILALVIPAGASVYAGSPDIVISQVYGGGGNSGATYTHDFIELFNRGTAAVSLAGWSVQYASATGTGNFGANSGQITELPDISLAPGQYLLVQEAQGSGGTTPLPSPDVIDSTPINMSASSGKVALANISTSLGCNGGSTACSSEQLAAIVDLVGYGSANFYEGAGAAPGLSSATAAFRVNGGCQDTDDNSADFVTGGPDPRNTGSPTHNCAGPTDPSGVGAANPSSVAAGQSSLLTVAVTPGSNPPSTGLNVTCDLAPIGGSATQPFFDDGTNEDVTAGDNTFTYLATTDPTTSAGTKTLSCSVSDAESRTGSATITLDVYIILPIGTVQGVVEDTDSGTSHASPYVGEYVVVQGVIYEKTQEYRSAGGAYYGFFLQNTAATADSDPNTSDGIFVFHLQYPTLLVEGGGSYLPEIGDEVILRGPVQERYNNTRLNNPRLIQVVRYDVDLDAEIPAFEVNPPATIIDDTSFDDIQDAYRYWERREGMRGQVPAGSTVLNGRDVFASSFDSEIWVARPDSLIAQRADAYERRSFRDMHPLDDIPSVGFDNENPYRILMGTFGVKAAADDTTALLAPARTYDTLTQAATGGVYYNFGKYSIQVDEQIQLSSGVDPSLNNPPPALDRLIEYSVVTFNVENLYDYYDDPFDGCDFHGNPGCPGVYPPFDYVPPSDDVYQARLAEIAQQIVFDLHSPDIIMAQEAEDQDVCTVVDGTYACGATDDADGKPDTLQELATAIASLGGPVYDAAYDRDGADDRGIISAYLYRTDRVELLPAQADNPVLGDDPQVEYRSDPLVCNYDVQNPKVLNAVLPDDVDTSTGVDGDNVFTRAPQVGFFRIWRDGIGGSIFEDLYLVDNHFSSGPDGRVGQRTEQANYNAAIVAALQEADPNVYVAVGGDLNVYPRPDDPFPPPDTSDQLAALYGQGMTNLWDVLVTDVPASSYGYVYQGQAQMLDQIFIAPPCLDDLANVWSAHINSDFPADYPGDGPRGTSDHDPVVAGYTLLPTLDRLEALVRYYDANGEITGNQTTRILLDRLERARRFMEKGQQDAYEDQLWAFISQVWDFTPPFITEHAAQALEQETTLLLSLP